MKAKVSGTKKKINGTTFLLMITILLFVVMYAAGMIVFNDKVCKTADVPESVHFQCRSSGYRDGRNDRYDHSWNRYLSWFCYSTCMYGCCKPDGKSRCKRLYRTSYGTGDRTSLWSGSGIPGILFGDPAIHCYTGRYVLWTWYDINHQYRYDFYQNATFMAWAKYKIYMPFGSYSKRGKFLPAYIYPTVIIAIIVLIVIIIVMKYTKFGRSVYAIGGNEQSALMMGLNVKRTKMAAYLLDGFLAGLGGFLFCMNSCAGFVEQAKGLEMDAISAAVIGGTLLSGGVGTPFGTLFGVLIKGTISSLITTQGTLSSWWVRIVLSALLCFFIVLQSVFASLKKKN